jgi:outer membrane protein OmpA-like peptidoglycan-associated protein
MIRNIALLALASTALSACATKGYVRNQVETGVAAERSAREAADTDINGKVTTLGTDLTAVKSEVATLQTDVAALRRDLTALRDEFGAKITAMENGMKFAFPVTFAFNDANIRDEDRASLDRFAQIVGKHYSGTVVTVEGHADPAGSRSYNKTLSQKRAESVASYLTTAGLTGVELRPVGMGEDRQVVQGADRDEPGAQTNRRVVFIVESTAAGRVISSIQP